MKNSVVLGKERKLKKHLRTAVSFSSHNAFVKIKKKR